MTLSLKETEIAYIAGFIDGDGCINAQIIRRKEYRLGFQIRISITFYQCTKGYWFLLYIQKLVPGGTLRKRKDGISEYTLVRLQMVQDLCELLRPYLKIKHRQAVLVIEIVKRMTRHQSKEDFLALCDLVDQVGSNNDSKRRVLSKAVVQAEWNTLFPVETS